MAEYPSAVYTHRTRANKSGVVYDAAKTRTLFVEDVNKSDDEIAAIENELGLNPSGAYATVVARLDALVTPPVKATGAELNTGTDDAKFATAKALADSDYAKTSDIPTLPVKATGAEIDTGTDDAKFVTPKALADNTKFPSLTSTSTLTNKRITSRAGTVTSHATPTINTDNVDFFTITAQGEAITSMTTNLSGTPTIGQKLIICITGTAARAIAWGTSFEASTVALPTTTVTTAMLVVGFIWNSITSKWTCVAVA